MRTHTVKIFKFEELSDEAKEKAREWYKEVNNDYCGLKDYLKEYLAELLEENGIKEVGETKLFYSLSYCQGDGACFVGSFEWKKYTAYISHIGHYYNEYSKSIELQHIDEQEDSDEQEDFNELYKSICREVAKEGYAYIESEDSDETVDANIIANEYEFLADGTRNTF